MMRHLPLFALLVGATVSRPAHAQSVDPALDVGVRLVLADAPVLDDDLVADSDAVSLRLAPSVVLGGEGWYVSAASNNRFIRYLDDDRDDRWRRTQRLEAGSRSAGAFDVLGYVERGDDLATAEFSDTDQWEAGARVERRFGAEHRLRLGGAWRWRDYADFDRSQGEGPEARIDYRYRIAANHYVGATLVAERIDSDNERRRFDRIVTSLAYTRPVAADLRVRPQLSYRALDYPGRPVPGLVDTVREDRVWLPELTVLYSPGDFLITGEFQSILRRSTDPTFDENGYRLGAEIGVEF